MTKHLAIALGIVSVAAGALFWLFIQASEARAVAEKANEALAFQIEIQKEQYDNLVASAESERKAYQSAAKIAAEWRDSLRQQIAESKDYTEGAAALITDEDWWCASEPTPAVLVDIVRINATGRSQQD